MRIVPTITYDISHKQQNKTVELYKIISVMQM